MGKEAHAAQTAKAKKDEEVSEFTEYIRNKNYHQGEHQGHDAVVYPWVYQGLGILCQQMNVLPVIFNFIKFGQIHFLK